MPGIPFLGDDTTDTGSEVEHNLGYSAEITDSSEHVASETANRHGEQAGRVLRLGVQTKWQQETKGRTTFRHTSAPSKKVLQLHEGLTKRQSAILVQLRTEKIGLRDFLFRRKVPDVLDPMCTCQEGRQTVRHILLTCRKLRDIRRQELGHLPEGNDLRAILSKRKVAIKAIKLIERAQILGQGRIVEA